MLINYRSTTSLLTHCKLILLLLVVSILTGCGGKSNYHYEKENDEKDLELAKDLGTKIYTQLLTKDSLKIRACFDKSMYNEISSFIKMIKLREEDWGTFHEFTISNVTSISTFTNKGDTTILNVSVNAVYDYNETWDDFKLQKIKNGEFKLIGYDFDPQTMITCGLNEIENLKMYYTDFTLALFKGDTAKIIEMCGADDPAFYNTILDLENEYFPPGSVMDSVHFNDGYIRKYCGKKGEANGIIIFSVYMNGGELIDMIYKLEKTEDQEQINTYSIYFSGELEINNEDDIALTETISKDLFKIIKKKDVEGFYGAFHTTLKDLYSDESKKDLPGIMDDYNELGEFDDFYLTKTFHSKNNELVYFVSILQLIDEDENLNYLEMVFKPDTNGKYMLMSCHELLH